jgi:replication-associated recombination protein RarA
MSVGFFVGATPTYMLSSTFKQDLCTLIVKKASIHRKKIPQFQVALSAVCATMMNPETQKDSREACTAFELQVPVSQRQAMEAIFTKVFEGTTANDLNFIYYKQRHHHHDVFYTAV